MLTALFVLLGLATAGTVAYVATRDEEAPPGGGGGGGGGGKVDLTTDIWGNPCPIPPITNPNPSSTAPMPNEASAPGFQWCHTLRAGDTPATIVAAVFGTSPPEFILELRTYNPAKVFAVNETVKFPVRWNPWMGQTGLPRGAFTPFPPYDKTTPPTMPFTYSPPLLEGGPLL